MNGRWIINNQTLYPVTKLAPALRRALLRVNPAYVIWSDEEKERYHVTLPAADRLRIEQQLLQDLFGIYVRDQKVTVTGQKWFR